MSRRSLSFLAVLLVVAAGDSLLAQPTPQGPQSIPAARRYREATKHTPRSVRSGNYWLDWSKKPALYRTYPGAPTVKLPPPKILSMPALAAIAGADDSADAPAYVGLSVLSAVLFLSGGIGATLPDGREIRTTAAAGGLYPNEWYVVAGDLQGLPAGVYHYEPQHEQLSRLRTGDWRQWLARAAGDERVARAPVTMVITGVIGRSGWKYRERAYRHLYWDGGMQLANALAAAAAADVPARVLTGFVDRDVDRLLSVDGRGEAALALLTLAGADVPPAGDSPSELPLGVPLPSPSAPRPTHFPEALRYHNASRLADRRAVARFRASTVSAPNLPPVEGTPDKSEHSPRRTIGIARDHQASATRGGDASLDAVVRRRRSTRRFASRPITAAELQTIVGVSSARVPADFLAAQRTVLETYVIVNAVRGLEAGAYHYRRATRDFERLQAGKLREVAGFLCLEQPLAYDASAVIFYLANLDAVGRAFGERGYRIAELDAGIVAGRAYLAAYALGRGATGLTFYDDEVTNFFSPQAAHLAPLLVVAVGVPAKRS